MECGRVASQSQRLLPPCCIRWKLKSRWVGGDGAVQDPWHVGWVWGSLMKERGTLERSGVAALVVYKDQFRSLSKPQIVHNSIQVCCKPSHVWEVQCQAIHGPHEAINHPDLHSWWRSCGWHMDMTEGMCSFQHGWNCPREMGLCCKNGCRKINYVLRIKGGGDSLETDKLLLTPLPFKHYF